MAAGDFSQSAAITDRVFPPITANPYSANLDASSASDDDQAAHEILALAHRPVTRRQRLGKRLSSSESIPRLLYLHRRFVEAELAGRIDRADFWWEETKAQWSQLPPEDGAWKERADRLQQNNATSLLCDPVQLRTKLSRELFLDTHVGFRNGLDATGNHERGQKHLEAALELTDDAALSDEEKRELDAQIERARIDECKSHGDWSEAIRLSKALGERYSGHDQDVVEVYQEAIEAFADRGDYTRAIDFAEGLNDWRPKVSEHRLQLMDLYRVGIEVCTGQHKWSDAIHLAERLTKREPGRAEHLGQLVDLHFSAATADTEASGEQSEAGARRQSKRIGQHVASLESIVKNEPDCHPAYEAIAVLCHMESVSLANIGRPSQALLAVEKALTYKPNWEEARVSRTQIESLLQSLLDQTSDVRKQLRQAGHRFTSGTDPRAMLSQILTSEGVDLFEEAETGTRLRDEFRNSKAERRIQNNLQRSRPRWFWMRMGLPKPASDWDKRARDLEEASDLLFAEEPADAAELMVKWQEIVESHPDLGLETVDSEAVLRLFTGEESSTDDADTDQAPCEATQSQKVASTGKAPAETTDGRHVPFLKPKPSRTSSDKQYVPFDFWLYSWRGLGTKAAFFGGVCLLGVAAVLATVDSWASRERDQAYQNLIEATAKLDDKAALAAIDQFATSNPLGRKDERSHHVERIERELTGWPNLKKRNPAYAALIDAVKSFDEDSAVMAARDFLAAGAEEPDDPRTSQVRELLVDAREISNREIRDREYANSREALKKEDHVAVLLASETYLEAVTENRDDPRTSTVWSSYNQAFSAWMIEQDEELDADALERVAKYGQLTSTVGG